MHFMVRKMMILPHPGLIRTNCYHSVVGFKFITSSEKILEMNNVTVYADCYSSK